MSELALDPRSLVSSISTSLFNIVGNCRLGFRKREPANVEVAPWKAVALIRHFHGVDIDEYRAKRGKEEGEAAFFHDNYEHERIVLPHNLFMFNGAMYLFQYAIANGTASANSAASGSSSSATYINNGNAYLYVGDGNASAQSLIGTVTVSNGSTSLTTSSGSSGLTAITSGGTPTQAIVINGDSSSQVYTITASTGSGTSWTISPAYGGTGGASAASAA